MPVPGCPRSASVADAGPGVRVCQVGKELIWCGTATSGGCASITDDGGAACTRPPGTTCMNACAPGEYSLSCGGLPPLPGSGGPVSYQHAPAECRGAGPVLDEFTLYCCPCQ